MTPLPILDLVAGLIFIYFLLALVNNSCIEIIASLANLRANMLEDWLRKTFVDRANEIMNNVLLNGVSARDKSTHYMDGKSFAKVVAEEIFKKITPPSAETSVKLINATSINVAIANSGLPKVVVTMLENFAAKTQAQKAIDATINEADHFERQIELWFDSVMHRLTGAYKRKTMVFTLVFAAICTVSLNIDSLQLASYLYSNPEARMKLATAAYSAAGDSTYIKKVKSIEKQAAQLKKDSANSKSVQTLNESVAGLAKDLKTQKANMDATVATMTLYIPISWPDKEWSLANDHCWDVVWYVLKKIGGLLMTILAICLGAPFWFDVLGKVANLRSSLKPTEGKKSSDQPKAA